MKIKETKMEKNVYSKVDAENWMILPDLSEIKRTSYIDVNDLVLLPKELFTIADNADDSIERKEVPSLFGGR